MTRRLALIAALALIPAVATAQENGQRKRGGGDSFIQLNTLTATTMRSDGRRGVMTVEAGVDVPDQGLRGRALASTPRLQAAYVEVVQTYAAGLPAGAVPNIDYLERELQRQTDMILGRPGARLLLGTVLVN
ncbi:MAG: hypothetical protein ACHP7N_18120 [Caulobacterales bacterium]